MLYITGHYFGTVHSTYFHTSLTSFFVTHLKPNSAIYMSVCSAFHSLEGIKCIRIYCWVEVEVKIWKCWVFTIIQSCLYYLLKRMTGRVEWSKYGRRARGSVMSIFLWNHNDIPAFTLSEGSPVQFIAPASSNVMLSSTMNQ